MKRTVFIAAFFGLVTVLAFWKPLFHPEYTMVSGGDMCAQTYPWFNVAAHWLKKGVLLLWDPYVYSGKATLGELQPGILYPLNWLVWLLPGQDGGISISGIQFIIVLHCFLTMVFTFFLARSLGMGSVAAAAASIVFALGGFSASLWPWVNIYSGFAWMPLVVLFFRRALMADDRRVRWRNFACSTVVGALALLAGHHAPLIHTGLFLLFFVLIAAAQEQGAVLRWARFKGLALLLLFALVTGGLVAAQGLPSAEYARGALRWVENAEQPIRWGERIPYAALGETGKLNPQDLVTVLLPYLSTSWNLYSGAPVLFLALVGLLFARGRDPRAVALMTFAYLFLSFGSLSALHGWLNSLVPGMWFAREVYLYLVPLQLCVALLAGWGLDRLVGAYSGDADPGLGVLVRQAGWTMAFLIPLAVAGSAAAHIFGRLAWDHVYIRGIALLAIYASALGALLFMVHTRRVRPTIFAGLLVALVLLDLSSHFSHGIKPVTPAPGQKTAAAPDCWKMPRAAAYLAELRRNEVFRVDNPSGILPPNFGDAWLIEETMGHGATARADYFAFRDTGWGPGSNASALLNARYFLSSVPVAGMPRPLAEEPLYRNIRALPRVFAADRYRTFDSDKDLLNWLSTPLFAPGDAILIRTGDLQPINGEFLKSVTREDEDIHVQPLSYWTSAERRAQDSKDEEERYRLTLFRPPWGWSVGDELAVSVRPHAGGSDYFLVLAFWPAQTAVSRLDIQVEGAAGSRTVPAVLPGLATDETPFTRMHHAVIPLGTLAAEEYRISLARTAECSAPIDSVRVTRFPPPVDARGAGMVTLTSLRPASLKIAADLVRPAFVVVSECWYPGWVAFVDGNRAPLLKVDHVLKAVPVTAGRHEIVLSFRPKSFQWGLLVSVVSVLAVAACFRVSTSKLTIND